MNARPIFLAALMLLLASHAHGQFDQGTNDPEGPYCQSLIALTLEDAEAGDISLFYAMGQYYHHGNCVAADPQEAVRWWRRAADAGYAAAQNNIGMSYDLGNGVTQDQQEAVRWFRLAAEQGYAQAQFNLGMMYASGDGVEKDYVTAHAWLNLADAFGHPRARGAQEYFGKAMSPEQIIEAQRRAADLASELFDAQPRQ